MAKMETICIVHETPWQAAKSDATTYVLALALILPGVWLASSAMQWLGVIVLFVALLTQAARKSVTIEQARARLDEIEKDRANDRA
jgi:hypothetical protein